MKRKKPPVVPVAIVNATHAVRAIVTVVFPDAPMLQGAALLGCAVEYLLESGMNERQILKVTKDTVAKLKALSVEHRRSELRIVKP